MKHVQHILLAAGLSVLPPLALAQQVTTTQYQYDAMGNVTKITDPRGKVTDLTYDPLQRLKQTQQPPAATGNPRPLIQYSYDGLDQLIGVTDPRNLATTYSVTGLGTTLSQVSPDTGTTGMTFDEAGNLKTRLDARGKTVTYTYDALNRLTKIDYPTGVDTLFEYDVGANAKGSLSKITDESGTTVYTYNGFKHIAQKVQTVGSKTFTTSYTYGLTGTATGKLSAITYPSGKRIDVSYDTAGRINSLTLVSGSVSTPLITALVYAPFGPPTSWVWGNTSLYSRSTDLDGRIASYPLGDLSTTSGAAAGVKRTVTYDAASRITGFTHKNGAGADQTGLNHSFTYDDLDRLTGWTQASVTHSYGYDLTGNRTTLYAGSSFINTIAPTSNRLSSTTGPAPAKTNTYDAAGNLTADGSATFMYSDRGRMASATKAGSTVTYLYNALEQRVQKAGPSSAVPTGTNYFVYDEAGHLLGEYDASGNPIQETVYLGDTPVAVLKAGTATPPPSGTPIIVDNTDTASVTVTGTWNVGSFSPGYQGTNYHAHAPGAGTENFVWRWTPTTTGTHTVNARWPTAPDPNRATNAAFTIAHAGGTATVTKDQNVNGGSFQTLGTYTFTAGTTYTVTMTQNASGYVVADAIQIVPPNTAPPSTPVTTTIDNTESAKVTINGTWNTGTYSPGYIGTNYHAHEPGAGSESFVWKWTPTVTDTHAVYAQWPESALMNRATNAAFTITHAGGSATVTKNQNANGGSFQLLGNYSFTAGTQYTVTLTQNAGGYVVADAIRTVSAGTPPPSTPTAGTEVFYVYSDQTDAPRTITRATDNKIVWTWHNADPFGMIGPNENPNAIGAFTYNGRFPGMWADKETGLLYNWNRYYSPELGRYITSDPLGLDGGDLSTYLYANAQPNRYVDPTGQFVPAVVQTGVWAYRAIRAAQTATAIAAATSIKGSSDTGNDGCCTEWSRSYEHNPKHLREGRYVKGRWWGPAPDPAAASIALQTAISIDPAGTVLVGYIGTDVIQFNWERDEGFPVCRRIYHGFIVSNQPVPPRPDVNNAAKRNNLPGTKKWPWR